MTKKISTTKQGFTIIEVVLVLAIAGLIFLMVFVAFPALQRNQRDNQRRRDYAMLESQVIAAASSNNGGFPSTSAYTIGQEGGTYGVDPKALPYTISFQSNDTLSDDLPDGRSTDAFVDDDYEIAPLQDDDTEVIVFIVHHNNGTKCDEDGAPVNLSPSGRQPKSFAIYAQLETGAYCRTASI